jgi:putative tricarboxylic transport membrane protein
MEQNPDFAWGLIASMYLGNVMLLLINIFMIPAFANVARVPFRTLAPIIIVLCTLGTFTVHGSIIEVGIMLACGVLGFYMRRFGMSPAALVIALVLGPLAEETLRQTMVVSGGDPTIFLERSTSMWLIVAIVVLLTIPLVSPLLKKIVEVRVREVGRRRRAQERRDAKRAAAAGTTTARTDVTSTDAGAGTAEGTRTDPGRRTTATAEDDDEEGRP